MSLTTLLHFAFPILRILLLLPLLASLFTPRTVYTSVNSDGNVETPIPTASSFLLPPDSISQPSNGLSSVSNLTNDARKYGTFRSTWSNPQRSAPTTRAATPAPSTAPDAKVFVLITLLHVVADRQTG